MDDTWVHDARRRLLDFSRCPACGATLPGPVCSRCGLGLADAAGAEIAAASEAVVRALDERSALIDRVRAAQRGAAGSVSPGGAAPGAAAPPLPAPLPAMPGAPAMPGVAATPGLYPTPVPPPTGWQPAGSGVSGRYPGPPPPAPGPPPAAPPRTVDVAGLVAVAALVFAFFVVPEAPVARLAVLTVAAGIAACGALVLRRRGIRTSAEAVGWLSLALALVDAWVVGALAGGVRWPLTASLVLVVGGAAMVAGDRARMRSWSAGALVLPLVPVLAVAHEDGPVLLVELGVLVGALVTLVRVPWRSRVRMRVGEDPTVEHGIGTATAVLLLLVALGGAPSLAADLSATDGVALGGLLVAAGAVALAQSTATFPRVWAWVAGAAGVGGVVVLVAGTAGNRSPWLPVAGVSAWLAVAGAAHLLRAVAGPRRPAVVTGGWMATLAGAVPAALLAVAVTGQRFTALALHALGRGDGFWSLPEPDALTLSRAEGAGTLVPGTTLPGVTVLVGAVAVAVALLVGARLPLPGRTVQVPAPGPATVVPGPDGPLLTRPLTTRVTTPAVVAVGRGLGPTAVVVACLAAVDLLHPWPTVLLTALAAAALALVESARRLPEAWPVWRATCGCAAAVVTSGLALLTWLSHPTMVAGAVLVTVVALRGVRLVGGARPVLVGFAVAHPALVLAVLLGRSGWSVVAALSGTALVLLALAVVFAPVRRLPADCWTTVVVVALVPAGAAVLATAGERTGWVAAVAGALVVLAGVVLGARSRPVPGALRVLAAAAVLPAACVLVINLGAVLLPGSAAPTLLPVVAVLAGATAVTAPTVTTWTAARVTGLPARGCRAALEVTAATTGAVALALAVVRESTGAATTLVLCAVLGAGATAVALRPDRRAAWWVAGLLWSGVLWSALAWSGVGLVEAYTAPPALLALVVAAWLVRREPGWAYLAGAGGALLVVPTLALTLVGRQPGTRASVLLAGAAVVLALAALAGRPGRRTVPLVVPLTWTGAAAALVGPARAVPATSGLGDEAFLVALGWSTAGAVLLAVTGALLVLGRPAVRRWAFAPALVSFTVGVLAGVRPSWTVVWVGLAVEVALLVVTVLSVRQTLSTRPPVGAHPSQPTVVAPAPAPAPASRPGSLPAAAAGAVAPARVRDRAVLPPVWFCWAAALAWAIIAWSPRELRVEVYALPLGLVLTAAGLVALHGQRPEDRGAGYPWPVGRTGSVSTLTPGILATLGPSLLAIWTDPMTWRAILVVVLALGFMLLGARRLLRAPLVVGASTLPVAVVSVFAAQLGRAVSAGPWLLTLLAAGGLLLVLGIYAERRRAAGVEDAQTVLR